MTLITIPNRPVDGDVRSIAPLLANFDTITSVVNGNLDSSNLAANGVTPSKLALPKGVVQASGDSTMFTTSSSPGTAYDVPGASAVIPVNAGQVLLVAAQFCMYSFMSNPGIDTLVWIFYRGYLEISGPVNIGQVYVDTRQPYAGGVTRDQIYERDFGVISRVVAPTNNPTLKMRAYLDDIHGDLYSDTKGQIKARSKFWWICVD